MTGALLGAWLACAPPAPSPSPGAPRPAVADAGPDRVAQVGEPVVFGGESVGASVDWNFGDGETGVGAQPTHTYAAPGHYTADVTATGSDGRDQVDTALVTVVWPAAPAARGASTVRGDATEVWVALEDFGQLAVVARATRAVRWVDTCGSPRGVDLDATRVAVACADDAVWVHDRGGAVVAATPLPRGSAPRAVLIDEDRVLVTLQGTGALAALTRDGALLQTVSVVPDAAGLARAPGGVLVSRFRSPDAAGEIAWLDDDLRWTATWTLPIDPGPDSDTNARGLPNLLGAVAVRPDGRVAVVPGVKHNIQRGLARDGLPLTFETTSRADLRQLALDPGEGAVGTPLRSALFDDRDRAIAAAYSPLGDWLYVAHEGMEAIDVLDAWTLREAGAVQDVGHGVRGLWAGDGELWVDAALSRELRVLSTASGASPVPLATVSVLPPDGEVMAPDALLGRILFHRSVDPRMATNGYLSCGSCHPDGEHDGRTWDFTDRGEGLRNTPTLRGRAGTGHGPIHWSANFDEIQDFEHDIRGPQAGLGFLSDADFAATSPSLGAPKAGLSPELDAIDAWLSTLTEVGPSPVADDPAIAEGEAVFTSLGCPSCHPPPTYTDSAWVAPGVPRLHDVGTLTAASGGRLGGPLLGLDTPTLRGLWATAPYLHDGSAATLGAVLRERNADGLHGAVASRTASEQAALEAFLSAIE